MTELSRYHSWYHRSRLSCRKTTAKFLVTLLILPSFPEQVYMAQQQSQHHRHHTFQQRRPQQFVQPRNIFHPNSTINTIVPTIGAMRHVAKVKGYYNALYTPSPGTAMTIVSTPPHHLHSNIKQDRHLSPNYYKMLPAPQNFKVRPPPPQLGGVFVTRPIHTSPHQKQFIQHNYPIAMHKKPGKCPGRKNIIDDIGIFSLLTAVMSSSFGMYTIIVNSMTSNNIGIVSGFLSLILWIPSTIISLFNLDGDYIWLAGNLLNSLSFVNSMYGFMGVFFGTADVLASAAGESVGVISFILSVIATFPEFLDSIIELLYRVGNRGRLEYVIENYGCEVPGFFRWYGKSFYQLVNDFLVNTVDSKGSIERMAIGTKHHNQFK